MLRYLNNFQMDTNISSKINEVSSSDTCVVDNNKSNCNGYESNLSQDVNDIMVLIKVDSYGVNA